MNAPSAVSIRHMPAANRIGSDSTARNGTWCVATPAEMASRPTSVAVSKPRPKSTPSGYICQLASILPPTPPRRMRLMNPRSAAAPRARSRRSGRCCIWRKTRTMSSRTSRFRMPISQRNMPGDAGADVAAVVLESSGSSTDRRGRDGESGDEREHDRRVAEREEEPGAERPLAVLQELAGGVVDRRDVVGVERVPQPERVRERAQPGQSRIAARVVEEQSPADHVQARRWRRRNPRGEPTRPASAHRPRPPTASTHSCRYIG